MDTKEQYTVTETIALIEKSVEDLFSAFTRATGNKLYIKGIELDVDQVKILNEDNDSFVHYRVKLNVGLNM